jgi:hypothetical protein
MIAKYLQTTYKRGARGPYEFDCWGLVREVRHKAYGRALLPSLDDAVPGDMRSTTKGAKAIHKAVLAYEVGLRPGAIAEAWQGRLCVHVGVVVDIDGLIFILETDAPFGPTLTKPAQFESRYTKVHYYDDQP